MGPDTQTLNKLDKQIDGYFENDAESFHDELLKLGNILTKNRSQNYNDSLNVENEFIGHCTEIQSEFEKIKSYYNDKKQEIDQNLDQINQAIQDYYAQYAQSQEAMRQAIKKARRKQKRCMIRNLVGMVAGAFLAPIAAPALLGGLGASGASSFAAFVASNSWALAAFQGAINGGINSALTKRNILEGLSKGALLAGFGDKFANLRLVQKLPSAVQAVTVSCSNSLASTALNGGNLGKNIVTGLGNAGLGYFDVAKDASFFAKAASMATKTMGAAAVTTAVFRGSSFTDNLAISAMNTAQELAGQQGKRVSNALQQRRLRQAQGSYEPEPQETKIHHETETVGLTQRFLERPDTPTGNFNVNESGAVDRRGRNLRSNPQGSSANSRRNESSLTSGNSSQELRGPVGRRNENQNRNHARRTEGQSQNQRQRSNPISENLLNQVAASNYEAFMRSRPNSATHTAHNPVDQRVASRQQPPSNPSPRSNRGMGEAILDFFCGPVYAETVQHNRPVLFSQGARNQNQGSLSDLASPSNGRYTQRILYGGGVRDVIEFNTIGGVSAQDLRNTFVVPKTSWSLQGPFFQHFTPASRDYRFPRAYTFNSAAASTMYDRPMPVWGLSDSRDRHTSLQVYLHGADRWYLSSKNPSNSWSTAGIAERYNFPVRPSLSQEWARVMRLSERSEDMFCNPNIERQCIIDAAAGYSDGVSFGLTQWAREKLGVDGFVDKNSDVYSIALMAGVATPYSRACYFAYVGKEFKFGKNCRIAPFGNRTGHPQGEWPHYHRRGPKQANGETAAGQGIDRHRPWESRKTDRSFKDRF